MALRSMIGKAVARERADGGRAPTINQLLMQKGQRTLPKEVEAWLDAGHDPIVLLESLAVHLIRTLPDNESEEAEKWFDGQRGRKGNVASSVLETEISSRKLLHRTLASVSTEAGVVEETALWANRLIVMKTLAKQPEGLTAAENKTHQHRLACITNTAPFLVGLRHEALLPVFGFAQSASHFSTLHPPFASSLRTFLANRGSLRLSGAEVARVAADTASALSHMHTLGFLHRNISCSAIYPRVQLNDDFDDAPLASVRLEHVMLGAFSYTVRTTRGRVPMSTWLPVTHAPETPHGRYFDWASDVYGLGLALLEMCVSGDQQLALSMAQRYATDGKRPDAIPAKIWDNLIAPCLNSSSDSRITAPGLRRAAEELEAHYAADGGARMDYIPLPQDGIDSATFSALQRAGAPPSAVRDPVVECVALPEAAWGELVKALGRNANLRHLTLRDSFVNLATLALNPAVRLGCIALRKCRFPLDTSVARQAGLLEPLLSPALTSIDLNGSHFGDDGAASIVRALTAKCSALIELDMTGIGAGRSCGVALVEGGHGTMGNTLEVLRIGANAIPATILGQLASHWLQRSTCLRVLDVSFTSQLDYFSVGTLGQVIRQSGSLREVDLRGIDLSSPSLWLLLSALKSVLGKPPHVLIDDTLDHAYAVELRELGARR